MPSYTPEAPQFDECSIAPKAKHPVKVIRSHRHLLVSNVEGVDCVPLPLSQALHQNGAGKALQQQAGDGLKARNTYVALGLLGYDGTMKQHDWWCRFLKSDEGLQNDEIEH